MYYTSLNIHELARFLKPCEIFQMSAWRFQIVTIFFVIYLCKAVSPFLKFSSNRPRLKIIHFSQNAEREERVRVLMILLLTSCLSLSSQVFFDFLDSLCVGF